MKRLINLLLQGKIYIFVSIIGDLGEMKPVTNKLRVSQKLEMLTTLFSHKPLRPVLDALADEELVEAHEFLWNKLVEIHYLTQKSEFMREEITRLMTPSAVYQQQQGCDLRLDYCKGVECIWSNPDCAGNKVKNNMEVMGQVILKYLDAAPQRARVFDHHHESQEWILQ